MSECGVCESELVKRECNPGCVFRSLISDGIITATEITNLLSDNSVTFISDCLGSAKNNDDVRSVVNSLSYEVFQRTQRLEGSKSIEDDLTLDLNAKTQVLLDFQAYLATTNEQLDHNNTLIQHKTQQLQSLNGLIEIKNQRIDELNKIYSNDLLRDPASSFGASATGT